MSPQEQFICTMADEIRAGRLIVTGDLSVRDFGHTYIEMTALDAPVKPPDFFRVDADLDCRKLEG